MLFNGRTFMSDWNSQLERARALFIDDGIVDVDDDYGIEELDDFKIKNVEDIIQEKVNEAERLM